MADTMRICRYCGSGAVSVGQAPALDGSIVITCAKCKNSYSESPPAPAVAPRAGVKPIPSPLRPSKPDAEKQMDADGLFKEGLALAAQRKFHLAATKLRAAADRAPTRVDILSALAGAASHANMQYEALAAWSRALELDPSNREALLKTGMLHIQRKRYDLGEAALRKLIELDPGADQARLLLDIAKAQAMGDGKTEPPTPAEKPRPPFALTIAGLIAESPVRARAMAGVWLAIPLVFVIVRYFAAPESIAAEWLLYAMLLYTVWFGAVIHEMGHGLAALWLGDDTALKSGRLTLDPSSHISFVGSVVVPVAAWFVAGVAVGWAKPVPFDPLKQERQPRDLMITAMAGPFASFALSYFMFILFLAVAAMHNMSHPEAFVRFTSDLAAPLMAGGGQVSEPFWFVALELASLGAVANLLIGAFNLIPVPPLDGGWLLRACMPGLAAKPLGAYGAIAAALIVAAAFSGFAALVFYPAYVAAVFYHFASAVAL